MLQELAGLQSKSINNANQMSVMTEAGKKIYLDKWEKRYPRLGEMFNGTPREQFIAAATSIVMRNQEDYIENIKRKHGESTLVGNLGQLAPRVIDVVRIFFPNMIANLVAEIQPLSSMVGQVLTVKPIFSTTGSGVNAGDEAFVNETDGTYASDASTVVVGSGDGTTVTFSGTIPLTPVRPATASVKVSGTQIASDEGNGNILGKVTNSRLNYTTGAYSITFSTAPLVNESITIDFRYDLEVSPDNLREMEISINLIPVQAKPHPLRVNWSVASELAASAAYDLDVEDTVSNLAAQFIRKERDAVVVDRIRQAAISNTDLNFDAANTSGITKKQHYQDWAIKMARAESLIFDANGRGNVSFVLTGINGADIIKNQASFTPEVQAIPIGAHKIGTLGGSVDVIKDSRLPDNEYLFGFRGMMTGDSALILAEWIPLYFTPTFQNSNLQNSRGLLSMYDTLMNNTSYYFKGTISNYTA